MTRLCAYPPCSAPFESSHPKARYCDPTCKAADWKRRTGYGKKTTVRTDAGRPGGIQLSWGPVLSAAVQLVYDLVPALAEQPELAAEIAEKRMLEAAPARQRARLEARGR